MLKSLVLVVLVSIFTFSLFSQEKEMPIIKAGKSFGNITLGESTVDDVVKEYGKKYKKEKKVFSEFFAKDNTYITFTYFKMIYKKQGLVFNFTQREGDDKEVLTNIEISSPFKAKTDKGIVIDESTFEDVIAQYGSMMWTYSNENKRVSKTYEGIMFSTFIKSKIKVFNVKEFNENYKSSPINYITISIPDPEE